MKFALDYDETFTEDPVFWEEFISLCKKRMHSVTFVTYRYEPNEGVSFNNDIKEDAKRLGIEVIFTHGKQKETMFDADIWIDDMPITIPSASALKGMYDGCINSGEDDNE